MVEKKDATWHNMMCMGYMDVHMDFDLFPGVMESHRHEERQ
jgi:hypothetical protein